jgi:NADH-quinone oxidoreductase subunit N
MMQKLATLWPEIAMFAATCVVMVVGLSPRRNVRRLCAPIAGLGLVAAMVLTILTSVQVTETFGSLTASRFPGLAIYGKLLVGAVGLLLLLLSSGVADRELEAELARGRPFDPLRSVTAEYYAFFLFSLTGLMLCAGADDLVWLFLALELTSLPTYVMVTISTARNRSLEAGVKYFFLGALGAAIFLYGFVLVYGGTGHTSLGRISAALAAQAQAGGINPIAMTGLVIALLGLCFKIAAVPMHFYTPDVYQGAAAPVGAFLAFVPKTAGFFAIMLLCASVGWTFGHSGGEAGQSLPPPVRLTLWVIAALTMTVGNVLAIWQSSVKRILAYSSIAHSGYMLVGVIAGPGRQFSGNGLAAVLFYLLAYGVMNLGAFAVLAALERRRPDGTADEIDAVADLRGLCQTHPILGWTMVLSSMGLLGLPLTLGFLGKVPLFAAGIARGEVALVIILGLNSAIAAFYYLRLAGAALLEKPEPSPTGPPVTPTPFRPRVAAGLLSAIGVVALQAFAGPLGEAAHGASPSETSSTLRPRRQAAPPPAADAAGPETGRPSNGH